ncbi:ATP binding [Rhizoctonia solani]|uniref:ATP binding n=1 Tax=Rhizoctonia solani TaxID=456999 RepID=A0A8H7IA22_9AGAM|nr:ATP binding [Rhizoctonia solani]
MASQGGPIQNGPRVTDGIWPSENKIVIGVDIGATHSGLKCGSQVKSQKYIVFSNGRDKRMAVSFGADAVSRDQEEAQKQGWTLAKEFKLHLQPVRLRKKFKLEGYIFEQTKICFEDRIIDGKSIWEKYMSTMQIVIGHPNGWSNREQAFLRNAAVKCGVFNTSQSTIAKNISFVTEAEASVHYCIQHTNLSTELKPGSMFAVCDAGGSTVDTTLYSVISTEPDLQLKEVRTSASIQAGAIFVNRAFEALLNKWMSGLGLSGAKKK